MSATIPKAHIAPLRSSRCHLLREMITNEEEQPVLIMVILIRNNTYTEWTMFDIITRNRITVRSASTIMRSSNSLWCCHCPRFSQAEDSSLSIPTERIITDRLDTANK